MTTQAMDDSLRSIRVNVGTAYAWDSLIGDTLPLATAAAYGALKRDGQDCDLTAATNLGEIRVANESDTLGADTFGIRYVGSWSEVWPLGLCQKQVEVTVEFTADGDGGAYTRLPGEKVRIVGD